jgi:hypothetical protein
MLIGLKQQLAILDCLWNLLISLSPLTWLLAILYLFWQTFDSNIATRERASEDHSIINDVKASIFLSPIVNASNLEPPPSPIQATLPLREPPIPEQWDLLW